MEDIPIVKPKKLIEIIKINDETKQPLMIWGNPGIGKSQILKEYFVSKAKQLKKEFSTDRNDINNLKKFCYIDIRLSNRNAEDIKGYPLFDNKTNTTKWGIPQEIPRQGQGALVFEEINLGNPDTQSASYSIILDRFVESVTIPKDYSIFATGNLDEDNSNVYEMSRALANRFNHVQLKPNLEDWTEWATKHKLDNTIIGFLSFSPTSLFSFTGVEYAYPTPRTYERLDKIIKLNPEYQTDPHIVCSVLGQETGNKYIAFVKTYRKIDLDKVIKEKQKPTKLDIQYAITEKIAHTLLEKPTTQNFNKYVSYVLDCLPSEMAILLKRRMDTSQSGLFYDLLVKNKQLHSRISKLIQDVL